jgi:hypothetical protein
MSAGSGWCERRTATTVARRSPDAISNALPLIDGEEDVSVFQSRKCEGRKIHAASGRLESVDRCPAGTGISDDLALRDDRLGIGGDPDLALAMVLLHLNARRLADIFAAIRVLQLASITETCINLFVGFQPRRNRPILQSDHLVRHAECGDGDLIGLTNEAGGRRQCGGIVRCRTACDHRERTQQRNSAKSRRRGGFVANRSELATELDVGRRGCDFGDAVDNANPRILGCADVREPSYISRPLTSTGGSQLRHSAVWMHASRASCLRPDRQSQLAALARSGLLSGASTVRGVRHATSNDNDTPCMCRCHCQSRKPPFCGRL